MSPGDDGEAFETASSFLDDREDGEAALEAVLDAEEEDSPWSFDDIAVDSGVFGELVSRGIVESDGDDYRVADPAAVRAVLDGEAEAPDVPDSGDDSRDEQFGDLAERLLPSIDRRTLAPLLGALALVAAARMTAYSSVFQHGYVVSPANDPYYFRYWTEQLLAESGGPTDFGVLSNPAFGTGEVRPMSHATNWFLAELLGGDRGAAKTVAAWLPIVASVGLGALIYKLGTLVSRDVRVGLAAVLVFAVAPIHAVYTGLAFFDHQLHQHFWLGVSLVTIAWLAVDVQRRWDEAGDPAVPGHLTSRATWAIATVFGVSVAFGTHAWGGSPLLLLPLAGYLGLRVAADVREGIAPLYSTLPIVTGLTIGAGIAAALHEQWGWHQGFVSYTPAFVLGGTVAIAATGELWRRKEWDLRGLLAVEAVFAALALLAFNQLASKEWSRARTRLDDLLFRETATETASLFTTEYFVFFGPLFQIGVSFYLALAVLGWVAWIAYRRYEPAWLLLGVYTGFLIVLAGIQVRFAGQLVVPLSVLGGLGLVYVLSAVDLARVPLPFRDNDEQGTSTFGSVDAQDSDSPYEVPDLRSVGYLAAVLLLVLGLNLIYVPSLTGQVTHGPEKVGATAAIDEDSTARNLSHPENNVLSVWDDSRLHNYHVNGESRGYGFARNNYERFIGAASPSSEYDRLGNRVGYVVLTGVDGEVPPDTTQAQLHGQLQTEDAVPSVGHYRLLYTSSGGAVAAYALIPGATISGSAGANASVTVSTEVTISGTTRTYERTTRANGNGQFTVRVAYPGQYAVGDRSVNVPESAVNGGNSVQVG